MGKIEGILEVLPRGEGQIRPISTNLPARRTDVFVRREDIKKYRLKQGYFIAGIFNERNGRKEIVDIESICGIGISGWQETIPFEDKVVIDPQPQIKLEPEDNRYEIPYGSLACRIIDLVCPLGFGQRALIVAPPRVGKTVLLQQIAVAIKNNYPEIELIMLLIDERPEEVTEMRRAIPGQVFASCNDRPAESHIRLGKLIIEYAKSLAQAGKDVVVMLDSITRLSRAFNIAGRGSGKIMTGGIDARAMEVPKRLFGAARKFEDKGSVTIIATALVDTGSRMDELIFREFKGTGNMELVLDRDLANERIFPAIDIRESGTRKDHLLIKEYYDKYTLLHKHLIRMGGKESILALLKTMERFPTNKDLLKSLSVEEDDE